MSRPLGTDTWLQGAAPQPELTAELSDLLKSTLGGNYDITGGQVASSENEKVVLISEAERRQRFGIECKGPFGDGITFHGGTWVPGGEYVQKLVVKNVSTKMKKLKYRLPSTRFFSLLYPLEIKLSPGTTQEFEVFFRPTRSEPYEDTIYFQMCEGLDSGGFHVPVRAFISTLQASVPSGLDMGLCPINVTSSHTFSIVNRGEVPAPFEWKVPRPFTFTPVSGVIPVNEAVDIVCTVTPTSAEVFVANAVCKVGEGVNATKPKPRLEMKVSAISKYPFVSASEKVIKFGEVIVNCQDEFQTKREIVVRNQSTVPAKYDIVRVENDRDPVFSVEPSAGVIYPGAELSVVIRYNPSVAGTYTEENYIIKTPGGNDEKLTFSGKCTPPIMRIYKKEDPFAHGEGVTNSINFRDTVVGSTVSRVLFLRNDSELPAAWCFVAEKDGIFHFSSLRGVIPPQFESSIVLRFTPQKPGNFYRRFFCLIENAAPQFIDVLGSGYIDAKGEIKEQRPAPIRHAHIQAFRNRVAAGLGKVGPAELEDLYKANKMSKLFAGVGPQGTQALAVSQAVDPITRSGDASRADVAVAKEFFSELTKPHGEIVLSTKELDFGYAAYGGLGSTQTFSLTNNCKEKVSINWFPKVSEDGSLPAYEVTPSTCDISPRKSAEFTVTFKPTAENFYFCEEVEAVVFFKSQRSFRLVTDATLQPPWNVNVFAVGHSFNFEQFLPKIAVSLRGSQLTFPSTFVGDESFQTFRITNMGNLLAQFNFDSDPSGVYTVKPAVGLIPANDFTLVTVRFNPKAERKYTHSLFCTLNNTPSMAQKIVVRGEGCLPRVEVENVTKSGNLYLKPTCVGLASERSVVVHNPTRIPLIIRVQLPQKMDGTVLSVSPRYALLMGNERCEVKVTFAPRSEKTYRCKMHIKVRAISGPAPDMRDARQLGQAESAPIVQSVGVTLVCPGGGGAVTFSPPFVDFGVKLVNYTEVREVELVNGSDCDLKYQMLHHLQSGGEGDSHSDMLRIAHVPMKSSGKTGHELLIMDAPRGILPARSKLRTKVTFQPATHGNYKLEMMCLVARVDADGNEKMVSPEESALLAKNKIALSDAAHNGEEEYYAELPEEKKDDGAYMPLKLSLAGAASFPKLVIRDVRVDGGGEGMGCSTDQLFGQLNLPAINVALATPLTPAEVDFNLQSSPDLSTLPVFDFPFTPAPIGSHTQTFFLELRNPETLALKFSIHLPNEKSVELETWADEGEPSEAEIAQNRIIDELKSFEVYPKSGELASGQSITLTMHYHYSSLEYEGKHELPLLFRVFQGKQFWIKCIGQTLDKDQAMVVPRTLGGLTVLFPVAVGTKPHEAPLQQTELMNVSAVPVEYMVDKRAIAQFNKEHGFGLDLLELENPSGVIEAKSCIMLRWRFMPLSPIVYKMELPFKFTSSGKTPTTIKSSMKFQCRAYDPRDRSVSGDPHRLEAPHVDKGLVPPPMQLIEVHSQKVSLSSDRLVYGRMPQRALLTRLVVVTSNSSLPIKFSFEKNQWQKQINDDALDSHNGIISVYPSEGTIEPHKTVLLKVTVSANGYPRVINETLAMEVLEIKPEAKAKPTGSQSRNTERLNALKVKVGDSLHHSVVGHDTLSAIGHRVDGIVSDLSRLKGDKEASSKLIDQASQMLSALSSQGLTSAHFFETIVRKLVKSAQNQDEPDFKMLSKKSMTFKKKSDEDDEFALKEEQENLDVIMEELAATYSNKKKEPEIELALRLWEAKDSGVLPPPSTANFSGSIAESHDGSSHSAAVGLPTTGMRGTMIASRFGGSRSPTSKKRDNLARGPAYDYVFMQITGEIVEDEAYFSIFQGDASLDGVRIPTHRQFVPNPREMLPFSLVPSDDPTPCDSRGPCGGSEESASAKSIVTALFSELVLSNDLLCQFKELPKEVRTAYLGEVQQKPPLMTSLQAAFDLFDVDASGTLTNAEVTNALKLIGLSYKDASVKKFLKNLDKNGDGEVDMREFLAGLDEDMAHKISDALENNENMIIELRAQRQRKMEELDNPRKSPRDPVPKQPDVVVSFEEEVPDFSTMSSAELEEQAQAALKIQGRARIKKSKAKVAKKRLLATAEGQEMDRAALMIQGRQRQRKAKAEIARAAAEKKKHKFVQAFQDEDGRAIAPRILDETCFNLLREAMATDVNDALMKKLESGIADHETKLAAEVDELKTLRSTDLSEEQGKKLKQKIAHRISNLNELIETREEKIAELKYQLELAKQHTRYDLNVRPRTFVRIVE